MKILDATCGDRSMWYLKKYPLATYMDIRQGKFVVKSKNCKLEDMRTIEVKPDVISEWKDAPFPDNHFDMVIFDPPHKIAKRGSETCGLEIRYGRLFSENWRQELQIGIKKLFDVLKPEGIFIFKWCETDKPVTDVLSLFPYPPVFGTRTGQSNKNHWIVFIKYRLDKTLMEGT